MTMATNLLRTTLRKGPRMVMMWAIRTIPNDKNFRQVIDRWLGLFEDWPWDDLTKSSPNQIASIDSFLDVFSLFRPIKQSHITLPDKRRKEDQRRMLE